MHIEGRLVIDFYPVAGLENRVSIQSSRPLQAARIFEGKTPEAVLMQLPLLFSVCGIAQATAALQAFQQAQSLAVNAPVETAHVLLMQMETAREHLWRILIDWPGFIDDQVDVPMAGPLQSLLPAFRKALFADGDVFSLQAELRLDESVLKEQIDHLDELLASRVFACPPAQWLRISRLGELDEWSKRANSIAARLLREVSGRGWQGLGAADCNILPDLAAADLNRRLDAPDADRFIAEPLWEERACESTPLTRQHESGLITSLQGEHGNGLLTRLAARLVELARIPGTMRRLVAQLDMDVSVAASNTLPSGTGIGQVEAARGRLVHRVVLDDGHVKRYQILAPTEWNFHPAGVVARGLGNLAHQGEATLHRQAAMLINAVDPCVDFELRVH